MIRIFNFLERFPFFPLSCSYSCSPLLPTLRTHTFHAMTLNFPGEETFENIFIMKKKVENCQTTMVMYFLCMPCILFSFLLPFIGEEIENVVLSRLLFSCLRNRLWISRKRSFISFFSMVGSIFMQYFELKKNFCDYIIVIDFSLSRSFCSKHDKKYKNFSLKTRLVRFNENSFTTRFQ